MKKCLHSRRSRNGRLFALFGCIIIGVYIAICSFYFQGDVILFLMGLAMCSVGVFWFIELNREYFVNSWGITVYYNKSCKISYSWEDIQSICVCDIDHAAKDRNVFTVVIRLEHGEEKNGPFSRSQPLDLSGLERWRSYGYNFLHRKNIIIVEYSDERLKEIEDLSGKNIYYFLTERAKDRGWYEDENGDHHLLNSKD